MIAKCNLKIEITAYRCLTRRIRIAHSPVSVLFSTPPSFRLYWFDWRSETRVSDGLEAKQQKQKVRVCLSNTQRFIYTMLSLALITYATNCV